MKRASAWRRMLDRSAVLALAVAPVAGAVALLAACEQLPASGLISDVVVVTSADIWAELEEEIVAELEPRMFTARRERIFEVAYLEPADVAGTRLRQQRQVVLIGSARDPVIVEALGERPEPEQPVVVQTRDVWAQNQIVTVALLPASAEPRALRPLLPKIRDVLLRQLENSVRIQVASTPTNHRLAAQLRQAGGFTLDVPYAYDVQQPEPGVFVFRDEASEVGPIIRNITIDSRARAAADWTPAGAGLWRAELAGRLNRPAHVNDTLAAALQGVVADNPVIQVQGVWSTAPGEWPAAGPFVSRMVECPERVFLLDAWVYAPADEKYEEMYGLDMILDTFQCPAQ